MATAFDAAVSGGDALSVTSLSWNHTMGAGANGILWVSVWTGITSNISGVTFNGSPLTAYKTQQVKSTGGTSFQSVYYILGPASGTHSVVVSLSATDNVFGSSGSWTGVNQAAPDSFALHVSADGATTLTTSNTTVADNCWVVCFEQGFSSDNSGPAAGAGSTVRVTDNSGLGVSGIFDSNGVVHPAGSYSMTTTRVGSASDKIGHILVGIAPPAVAVSIVPIMMGTSQLLKRNIMIGY